MVKKVSISVPIDQAAHLLRIIAMVTDYDDVDFDISQKLQKTVVAAVEKSKYSAEINEKAFDCGDD